MASGFQEADWIWKEGELIPWGEATVHLLSTAVQFGSSVFEGIRCYDSERGPAIFRLRDHLRRLTESCRTYRLEPGYGPDDLERACVELVRSNQLASCYLRPMVLRGYGAAGLDGVGSPVETFVAAWPWGAYLGEEGLSGGVDVCVSSWHRSHPNTYPSLAKSAGHYNSSQLIKMEADANGYAEAIALGPGGLVSEGSGQNVFAVRDGLLLTPILDGTSLSGITRHTVIELAIELGIEVKEQPLPREMLYAVDELFFTGTAAEVTPIRSVDRIPIGNGGRGEMTEALQKRFMDLVHARIPDERGWLTIVD